MVSNNYFFLIIIICLHYRFKYYYQILIDETLIGTNNFSLEWTWEYFLVLKPHHAMLFSVTSKTLIKDRLQNQNILKENLMKTNLESINLVPLKIIIRLF